MPKGCAWGFVNPDKDDRPWYERGFNTVEPVSTYANQSEANQRTDKYLISPDGSDPKEGYPDRQEMSKDSGSGRKKGQA